MFLRGQKITVGGLASVVSAAEDRRRGHVRALISHGLEMLHNDGFSWCLEYPFDTRYYRRLIPAGEEHPCGENNWRPQYLHS